MKILLLIIAQYAASDIEALCGTDGVEELLNCTHAQRIHLGLYAMEQLPYVIRLHGIYREQGMWSEASDTSHYLSWLVLKNDLGHSDVLPVLTWIPESRCFEKEGWRYVVWVGDCRALRFMVADSHILGWGIAEGENRKKIALRLAYLVLGIMGKPTYVMSEDFTMQLNLEIPGKYRADVWLRRAR